MSSQSPPDGLLKQSRDLIRKQKYSEAAEVLQKLLEHEPNDEDALEMLGLARFFSRDLIAARDAFETLTQVNSGHISGWVNLGAVLNRMGEHKKAVEILRRALQKDRRCAEGYYNMGIAQRALNLNTMSISAYKEAIKLKPKMIDAHLNLGNIYLEMKNIGLALQCFQSALRHDPDSKKAKLALEKAQATQKTARKEVSPFGRLVNVEELERQQVASGPRELDQKQRQFEREMVQEVTKQVRTAAKELVPLLDEPLHGLLHRLERCVLQKDMRPGSSELTATFTKTIGEIHRLKSLVSDGLGEIRRHLNK